MGGLFNLNDMTSEETNLELIKTLAHVQAVLRGLDNLKDVSMHESVKRILEDSKHVFKATEKHIVKDWEIINKQMHNIDSDMMETIIEAFQYKINQVVVLGIEDVVTIKD